MLEMGQTARVHETTRPEVPAPSHLGQDLSREALAHTWQIGPRLHAWRRDRPRKRGIRSRATLSPTRAAFDDEPVGKTMPNFNAHNCVSQALEMREKIEHLSLQRG